MGFHHEKYYYLITLQYLGFRYHGWARQPGVKTVQEQVEKTLNFIFPDVKFKVLAAGRTDSMVSATGAAFELFINEKLNIDQFLSDFNINLPPDIRAIDVKPVSPKFNVIHHAEEKEYHYLFCTGVKPHPFSAAHMAYFPELKNVELMKEAAQFFKGEHDFMNFCHSSVAQGDTVRKIDEIILEDNTVYTANFFPEQSWIIKIRGKGFMRYQIRMMVGALALLGMEKISLDEFKGYLDLTETNHKRYVAPSSGLNLYEISFDQEKLN
ncbi:tRNA pseudouridine(38-40) synthase TruA [Marinigracilibium pacificum]|uniref:tRNA pseudouridine synthase A n=1 Tax=Marinigracilibium pacificum TaxID=2729599 RepID=A0A848IUH3_9BACT|nr:tRNA pseudouridine(38-40) synthase TruA [Marinigracilibium pacificum]NMM48153.1 tRNA pseudouridine(38-40) synthase TruA [Marinigracilibium pacificum]